MARIKPGTVVGRIFAMIASLLSTSWLFRHTVAADLAPLTVFRTVYVQCILILVTLLYYFVLKLCSVAVCRWGRTSRHRSRRRGPDGSPLPPRSPSDSSPTGTMVRPMTVISSVSDARLTIRNVWIFVFGLGLVFFITAYCFIGLNPVCLSFLGMAVSVLAVDELICPKRELSSHYAMGRTLSLLCCVLGLFLVTPPILESVVSGFVSDMDIYSALFGIAFPFLSQMTLSVVRDHRVYTWRSILEACEFGFPFTGFLGVFHLCVAYGQRQQADSDALSAFKRAPPFSLVNTSAQSLPSVYLDFQYWYHFNDSMVYDLIDTNGPFLTFYTLTPLAFVPACVCFTWCVLDGCAVDPLFAVVAVLCLEHSGLVTSPHPSGWDIAGAVFCAIGLCARIVCEYRPVLSGNHPHIYSMQGDSPQLPYYVVWMRGRTSGGPSMQECEAETQELSSDFPQSRAGTTQA